jgi:large subunit ribosomal protein L6
MSRVGKQPVAIPSGVQVETPGGTTVRIKGPKGSLEFAVRPEVAVAVEGKSIVVTRKSDTREARAYHGTARATLQSMVVGVTQGYQKDLDIIGVGWNAAVQARKVVLNVGYCNPVEVDVPEGINATCPNNVSITITGADKQGVGQLAAKLRAARPPEPYKGKGVRYKGEYVKIKAGKSFGS